MSFLVNGPLTWVHEIPYTDFIEHGGNAHNSHIVALDSMRSLVFIRRVLNSQSRCLVYYIARGPDNTPVVAGAALAPLSVSAASFTIKLIGRRVLFGSGINITTVDVEAGHIRFGPVTVMPILPDELVIGGGDLSLTSTSYAKSQVNGFQGNTFIYVAGRGDGTAVGVRRRSTQGVREYRVNSDGSIVPVSDWHIVFSRSWPIEQRRGDERAHQESGTGFSEYGHGNNGFQPDGFGSWQTNQYGAYAMFAGTGGYRWGTSTHPSRDWWAIRRNSDGSWSNAAHFHFGWGPSSGSGVRHGRPTAPDSNIPCLPGATAGANYMTVSVRNNTSFGSHNSSRYVHYMGMGVAHERTFNGYTGFSSYESQGFNSGIGWGVGEGQGDQPHPVYDEGLEGRYWSMQPFAGTHPDGTTSAHTFRVRRHSWHLIGSSRRELTHTLYPETGSPSAGRDGDPATSLIRQPYAIGGVTNGFALVTFKTSNESDVQGKRYFCYVWEGSLSAAGMSPPLRLKQRDDIGASII